MNPTARSLKLLRELGYDAGIVERRLPRCNITKDLFGCIDLVAIRPGEILGIQATSRANQSARMQKAMALPALMRWLHAGGRFEVWGWAKTGPRGSRKTWQVSRHAIIVQYVSENDVEILQVNAPLLARVRDSAQLGGGWGV